MGRKVLVFVILVHLAVPDVAQQAHRSTERTALGLKGPVRSVLTAVTRVNPDPRPERHRNLSFQEMPDWAAFDVQGKRVEFASMVNVGGFESISTCKLENDGTTVFCTDTQDHQHDWRKQQSTLSDGSREVTYSRYGEIQNREVTRFDDKGNIVNFRNYDGKGRLRSEDATLSSGDNEWKLFDGKGRITLRQQTRIAQDKSRFDRWSYDSDGRLVWHIALNRDGALLSSWYDVGYKPKQSSSDSLGICGPRLWVWYKFDEQGSGRMEKLVEHTSGESNLEPDSEEHYNLNGILDEKAEIKYARDRHGNWTSRAVFVWAATSNQMIEVERDTRRIEYY